MEQLDRITQTPDVMGGRACIRGMRVTVGMIVGQIGAGREIDDLRVDYPYLEREDIIAAVRQLSTELEAGALLTVEPGRTRARLLPLEPR